MTSGTSLRIIGPGDPGYDGVRHVYSGTGSPARVLLPVDAEQTARALEIAVTQGDPFSIRSGGHGISSIATNDGGTVIDMRHIKHVQHLGAATVAVGAGARWGAVARSLYGWGLAITSGDSGDVGVGGLATTGGIGLLGRAQGLTIDRLRAAEIVTADGRILRVSDDEHPDLFWAVRGAGANVGIVTRFEFEAGTTPTVARASLAYEIDDAPSFLTEWGHHVETAPREISAFLYIGAGPRPFAQATVVYAGDDAASATRAITPFTELPGVVGARAELVPYPAVPLTTGAPQVGQQPAVMHTALADHLDDDLTADIGTLLVTNGAQMVQIRSAGGAINDVPADATAYAHRHQNFSVTAVADRATRAFDDAWEPIRARRDGIYLSFESNHRPEDLEAAFPAPTLSRLRAIKHKWDPDGVFTQNFDAGVR